MTNLVEADSVRALDYAKAGKLGLVVLLVLVALGVAAYQLVKHPEDRRRLEAWLRERAAFRQRTG